MTDFKLNLAAWSFCNFSMWYLLHGTYFREITWDVAVTAVMPNLGVWLLFIWWNLNSEQAISIVLRHISGDFYRWIEHGQYYIDWYRKVRKMFSSVIFLMNPSYCTCDIWRLAIEPQKHKNDQWHALVTCPALTKLGHELWPFIGHGPFCTQECSRPDLESLMIWFKRCVHKCQMWIWKYPF